MLLNTSFNENEPIVASISEAYECFKRTKMDALIIENKILIRDRSAFDNLENCVRITIGSKKQIIRVLDVMTN